VVVVATVRALKVHGGVGKDELPAPDATAVERGFANLSKHIDNLQGFYGLPVAVAINRFDTDSAEELDTVVRLCAGKGVTAVPVEVWAKGGEGGIALAQEVIRIARKGEPRHPYALEDSIETKIEKLAHTIYGAGEIHYSAGVSKDIAALTKNGYGQLPVCIAKTQYSLSHDPKLLGRPEGFRFTVRGVKLSAGAGFVVVMAGDITTMPGLPKVPAAEQITIDDAGQIDGLF
jgi:formate--tetrahydrofolate ligase